MNNKFRLWCGNKNEWEKGVWFISSNGDILDSKYGHKLNSETHILLKYTSKTDINHKRICVGDIVKAYKYNEDEFIHQINYRHDTLFFGNWTWIEFLNKFRRVEIIGNIYENPELLEELK